MSKQPQINDARAIGQRYGLKGVVIMHHDGRQAGYVSWGHDRHECSQMRRLADRLFAALMDWWASDR